MKYLKGSFEIQYNYTMFMYSQTNQVSTFIMFTFGVYVSSFVYNICVNITQKVWYEVLTKNDK